MWLYAYKYLVSKLSIQKDQALVACINSSSVGNSPCNMRWKHRGGVEVNITRRSLYSWERSPVLIAEDEWDQGPIWTGVKKGKSSKHRACSPHSRVLYV